MDIQWIELHHEIDVEECYYATANFVFTDDTLYRRATMLSTCIA